LAECCKRSCAVLRIVGDGIGIVRKGILTFLYLYLPEQLHPVSSSFR